MSQAWEFSGFCLISDIPVGQIYGFYLFSAHLGCFCPFLCTISIFFICFRLLIKIPSHAWWLYFAFPILDWLLTCNLLRKGHCWIFVWCYDTGIDTLQSFVVARLPAKSILSDDCHWTWCTELQHPFWNFVIFFN